jgi:hypothetical protein
VLKKLLAPGLEKAPVFLDERLMGTTSNAVERGNRRYRKMQKRVYRVRTRRTIKVGWRWTCCGRARPEAGPARLRPCTTSLLRVTER